MAHRTRVQISYKNHCRLRETGVLIGDVAQPEGALRRGEPGRPELHEEIEIIQTS